MQVTWAGSPDRVEARLVPEAGFPFDGFRISGLPRRPGLPLARSLGRAGVAPLACLRILAARRPDVVLGGGGYVSGPMVLAAALRGVPAALTEADAHLGVANRLALPFARRLFLSFPIAGVGGAKVRVTGRPIPARSRQVERAAARELFGLPAEGPVLLVFGGSQGSRALNELMVAEFGAGGDAAAGAGAAGAVAGTDVAGADVAGADRASAGRASPDRAMADRASAGGGGAAEAGGGARLPAVLHLCGERDFAALEPRVRRDGYRLVGFTDDFGAALAASDLAIARSGGSVWELAAAGKPAVLVPYPYATADHQTKNARYFEAGGGAVIVPERELERVPGLVRELLADPARLAAMRAAMLALARPHAADEIAEELIALAR